MPPHGVRDRPARGAPNRPEPAQEPPVGGGHQGVQIAPEAAGQRRRRSARGDRDEQVPAADQGGDEEVRRLRIIRDVGGDPGPPRVGADPRVDAGIVGGGDHEHVARDISSTVRSPSHDQLPAPDQPPQGPRDVRAHDGDAGAGGEQAARLARGHGPAPHDQHRTVAQAERDRIEPAGTVVSHCPG